MKRTHKRSQNPENKILSCRDKIIELITLLHGEYRLTKVDGDLNKLEKDLLALPIVKKIILKNKIEFLSEILVS